MRIHYWGATGVEFDDLDKLNRELAEIFEDTYKAHPFARADERVAVNDALDATVLRPKRCGHKRKRQHQQKESQCSSWFPGRHSR